MAPARARAECCETRDWWEDGKVRRRARLPAGGACCGRLRRQRDGFRASRVRERHRRRRRRARHREREWRQRAEALMTGGVRNDGGESEEAFGGFERFAEFRYRNQLVPGRFRSTIPGLAEIRCDCRGLGIMLKAHALADYLQFGGGVPDA